MPFTSPTENEPFSPTFVPETQLSDRESPIELVNLEKVDSDIASRRKRSTWSKVEDEVLARSFVTISDDPIIGNDQNVDAFWGRIASYYNENRPPGTPSRIASVIRSHWHNTIQKKVYRFNVNYNSVYSVYRSDHSDEDILRLAYEKYREENNGIAFNLEHQRDDAARRKGLSPLQKCTAAIHQLSYGVPADHLDEYLRMGESTAIKCLFKFCGYVVEPFGDRYLRRPNADDVQRLLQMHNERHDFPGMLGSRNDINVLYESPIFNNVLQGNAPKINFTVNGTQYTKGYYLTDGIYPEWATFVKAFPCPEDPKRRLFKERQEAVRKDVERAFGVLQARWAIVRGPARYWYRKKLKHIMLTCIILHNMIVEDEGEQVTNWYNNDEGDEPAEHIQGSNRGFHDYLRTNSELCDSHVHHQLRADLVEHIWSQYNNNP
ncbi:uncharacterized protein LOC121994976 [Zingiber officinale]|uniref:uncharacterized protein LOC121994976 n=1 Tax=Zingiber officinale TaxID=94328 RepID=UPI001C4DB5A0|nr:uncharacterized protein LOC121994976 [Zingiber officinale]